MTAGQRRADRGSAANVLSASRRRSQDARQVPHCRGLAPGMAILGSQAGLRAAGAPWWTICLLGALGLAAACLQIVFPQDSPDKVAWWSERRRTQRRHRWRQGGQRRRRCQCQHDSRFRVLRNCAASSGPTGPDAGDRVAGPGVADPFEDAVQHRNARLVRLWWRRTGAGVGGMPLLCSARPSGNRA
jgi:hypothetical protein